jgi:hypothetical protein
VEIWDQINETLKVLEWPVVVGGAIWIFRRQIARLTARVREAETPIGTVRFEAAEAITAAATRVVTSAAEIAASTGSAATQRLKGGHDPVDEVDPDSPSLMESEPPPATAGLLEFRDEIEDLIRVTFQAGYTVARATGTTSGAIPRPIVNWDGAQPRMVGWSDDRNQVRWHHQFSAEPAAAIAAIVGGQERRRRELLDELKLLDDAYNATDDREKRENIDGIIRERQQQLTRLNRIPQTRASSD